VASIGALAVREKSLLDLFLRSEAKSMVRRLRGRPESRIANSPVQVERADLYSAFAIQRNWNGLWVSKYT
jgi:hypothetical protein